VTLALEFTRATSASGSKLVQEVLPKPLPKSFFQRPAEQLALALLGCRIIRGPVVMAITEVEAYGGQQDTASHARFGKTARNTPMWGPGGNAYVYLCYGIHNMLNITADEPGQASAVLIRACEPIAGLDEIRRRRGAARGAKSDAKSDAKLLAGPGKVGAALQLDPSWSGHPLYRAGDLYLAQGDTPSGVLVGPRVGIDYAEPADRARPWRFAAAGSTCISHPSGLMALTPRPKRG
jgi:DNA-3-methyladenine glycosylase